MLPSHFASGGCVQRLDPALAAPCADARALVGLLNVDSCAKMGHAESKRADQLAADAGPLLVALTASAAGPDDNL